LLELNIQQQQKSDGHQKKKIPSGHQQSIDGRIKQKKICYMGIVNL
jgi:hypothetical protein